MNELLSRWSSPTGPPGLTELIYHDEREVSKNPASNNGYTPVHDAAISDHF